MSKFDYDLFVIGGGSGGVRSARLAAQGGAKVAIAEEFRYGGTCVIRGCVPKKLLVYASSFSETFEDAAGFGWTVGDRVFDWATLRSAKDKEISRLEGLYAKNVGAAGAEVFHQRAEVEGAHEVRLVTDDKVVTAKHILIATGGAPFVPNFPGSNYAITSNEIFDLPDLPARTLVVGGGYIASEFAGILNGLGSKVTQAYRKDLILRGFDEDLRKHVSAEMKEKGIDLRYNTDVEKIAKSGDVYSVTLTSGEPVEVDCVLYATGRKPDTNGLGLDRIGVEIDGGGAISVDEFSQTSVPSIYAVGDVTGRVQLTPVAIKEGVAFIETVFRENPTKPDHTDIATAVFTQPEIGTVGLSEAQARELGDVQIYKASFRPMMATISGREEKMLMKLVVTKADRRVRGVHIVGHGAGEMIQLAGIAVKMGATKDDFDRTMPVHPTAAEELVTMSEPI